MAVILMLSIYVSDAPVKGLVHIIVRTEFGIHTMMLRWFKSMRSRVTLAGLESVSRYVESVQLRVGLRLVVGLQWRELFVSCVETASSSKTARSSSAASLDGLRRPRSCSWTWLTATAIGVVAAAAVGGLDALPFYRRRTSGLVHHHCASPHSLASHRT